VGGANTEPDEAEVERRLKEMDRLSGESDGYLRELDDVVDIAKKLLEMASSE
jgi:hypothetical protein